MEQNNREIAIQLSGVKKMYKLGQIGGGTLQADLQSWWARKRGKEDPNTKIGTDQRLIGKTFMALNGIDLTIYKGEAVGIIGSNGAGKSTMLKLLSRVTAPTEGDIDINGRIASMLEVGTGFHPEMTGRENVYLNGAILGMTKEEIDAKMEQIIEFSEVRDFIDTPVKRYSSGMFVKLAFSVAAHLDSEIMIMDEVLAVGDMAFQKKCLDKMREAAKKQGRTVLYVSHNMDTIRRLCDRCIVLDKGKVAFEGDVDSSIEKYLENEELCNTIIDFSFFERPKWISKYKIKVSSVELLDKDCNVYKDECILKLKVSWSNLEYVSNMGALIEVCSIDDVAQASYDIYDFYSGNKGEVQQAIFKIDISVFYNAKYKIRLTFFEKNDVDDFASIEWVSNIFFEKKSVHVPGHLNWNVRNWGYIKPPVPGIELL